MLYSDINTEPLPRQETTQQTETQQYIYHQNNLFVRQTYVQITSSLKDVD